MQKSYISVDGKDADRACGGHPFCINLCTKTMISAEQGTNHSEIVNV